MFKQSFIVGAVCAPFLLVGCSGGGGSGSSATAQPASIATQVKGPLDPVQGTLNSAVFTPLVNATSSTPLSNTLQCTNAAVNGNLLNVVDALANALQTLPQNPGPGAITAVAPQIQQQVQEFAGNLQTALLSLANGSSCGTVATGGSGNPFAGTPLAGLGTALQPVIDQLGNLGDLAGGAGGAPGLGQLQGLLKQIATQLQDALPAAAKTAPVLGPLLSTLVPDALNNLGDTLGTLNDPSTAAQTLPAQLQTTVTNLLNDLTTLAPGSGAADPTQIVQSLLGQLPIIGQLIPGGSSGSGGGSTASVSGPLDPVQAALSADLFQPLANATSGTPLKGVLTCANAAVNGNVLDVVDALAGTLEQLPSNPSPAAFTNVASVIQAQITDLAGNLQNLLTSLAGQGSCTAPSVSDGSNPLAGTPLGPIIDQLQALPGLAGNLQGGGAGIATLTNALQSIATQLQSALPAQVTTAPVLGPLLTNLVPDALTNLGNTLATLGDPSTVAQTLPTQLQTTVTDLINDLVGLAPAGLPGGAGLAGGDPTQIIQSLVGQLIPTGSSGGSGSSPLPDLGPLNALLNPLSSALAPLLSPLLSQLPAGGGTPLGNIPVLGGLINTLTGLLGGLVPAG